MKSVHFDSFNNVMTLDGINNSRIFVVIPASGIGERACSNKPKQFWKILGKTILQHTAELFIRLPFVSEIVITGRHEHSKEIKEIIHSLSQSFGKKLKSVDGGLSRHRSIFKGIHALDSASDNDIVIIHDAVRPIVSEKTILDVVSIAIKHGACGISKSLVSTIISADSNNYLYQSLDRSQYACSEMPQAFRFGLISKAYQLCCQYDLDHGTECLQLVEKYCNFKAKILNSSDNLWKVTHPADFFKAKREIIDRNCHIIISDELVKIENFVHEFKSHLSQFKIQEKNSISDVLSDSSIFLVRVMLFDEMKVTELKSHFDSITSPDQLILLKFGWTQFDNLEKIMLHLKNLAYPMKKHDKRICCVSSTSSVISLELLRNVLNKISAIIYDGDDAFQESMIVI